MPTVPKRWSSVDLLLLGALSLVAIAIRLASIEQWSFGAVEAIAFRAVSQPLDAQPGGLFGGAEAFHPVGYLSLRWLFEIGLLQHATEGWLRLPFAFVGAVTVPLLALYARPLVGLVPARLAAVVLVVHPAHIAASQTADPLVMAVPIALVAGVLARSGRSRLWSWPCLVLAGACHPVGWLVGVGSMLVAPDRGDAAASRWASGRRSRALVVAIATLSGAVLLADLVVMLGAPLLLLAVACLLARVHERAWRLSLVTVALLAAAAVLRVSGGGRSVDAVLLGAVPFAILLAACACRAAYRVLADLLPPRATAGRVLAAAPSVILIGELVSATFLYFTVYDGGRPAWREVRDAVAVERQPGHEVRLFARRGVDVLQSYLRPQHWRERGADPHPGLSVSRLPQLGAGLESLLDDPDTQLVLLHDEHAALARTPAGAAVLAQFEVTAAWPGPQPYGDVTVYLLRRRAAR